jgi:hypothetical protein
MRWAIAPYKTKAAFARDSDDSRDVGFLKGDAKILGDLLRAILAR